MPGSSNLPDDYIDQIDKAIKGGGGPDGTWNIGEGSDDGQEGGKEGIPGDPNGSVEDRTWKERQKTDASNKIDDINRKIAEGIKNPWDRENRKSGKTKSTKGQGGGDGPFRDRLIMETIASVDWRNIFRKRLTEYSKKSSKWKPWDKRYSGNRMLRTRIPSRRIPKNALPETNIAIDTSASMSFAELEVIISEIQAAVQIAEIKKVNVILWTGSAYWDKSYNKVDPETFNEIKKDIADNWRSGGTTVRSVYEKLKEKGWTKKFTIIFTDGYTENHGSDLMNLVSEVLDLNNTLWGIIQPGTGITVSQWESITDDKPGEVVPIFLDRSLFNQGR